MLAPSWVFQSVMPFMPLAIFPMFVLGVASLALLLGASDILYQWAHGIVISTVVLSTAIAMLAVALFGRSIVLIFHRRGADDPSWERDTKTMDVQRPDGTVLHVEMSGASSGPPIILVHGWGVDNRAFYYTKRRLATQCQVIAWDLRGLGKSSRARNNDYSLDAMADDLAAVVDLASAPVTILGHSIGGMIAQTFARRHTNRLGSDVKCLILVGTTYTDPTRTTAGSTLLHALKRPLLTPLMYLTIALWPLIWAMNWLSYFNGSQLIATALTGFTGKETRAQLDFASRFFAKARPSVLARGMLAMFNFDETSSIGNIPIPVSVIPSGRDIVLLPRASHYLARIIPNATLRELADAKHMGLVERHTTFNDLVMSAVHGNAAPVVATNARATAQ